MMIKIEHWSSEDQMSSGFVVSTAKAKYKCCQSCDSPEDAIFGRNLDWYDSILALVREAYEAGKNGDPLEICEIDENG